MAKLDVEIDVYLELLDPDFRKEFIKECLDSCSLNLCSNGEVWISHPDTFYDENFAKISELVEKECKQLIGESAELNEIRDELLLSISIVDQYINKK